MQVGIAGTTDFVAPKTRKDTANFYAGLQLTHLTNIGPS